MKKEVKRRGGGGGGGGGRGKWEGKEEENDEKISKEGARRYFTRLFSFPPPSAVERRDPSRLC